MKKAVFIVLAAMLLAFGLISNAMAIDGLAPFNGTAVNPGALGSALIYGYYNVRGNINIFNIVNTNTVDGEKVRVVFRAGKTSEEVLDFAVCLTRADVWTAFLIDNGTTAAICPFDTDTVTAPTIPGGCQAFKIPQNSNLTNDDLREGYFEVLGFSSIPGFDENASDGACIFDSGVAANCIKTAVDCSNWCTINSCANGSDVSNSLMGNNTIVNLSTLATYSYNASAVWISGGAFAEDPGPTQEVQLKDLASCFEIENMLLKEDIISPYDVMSSIGGGTAVIVTFPTRFECHGFDEGGPFNCVANDKNTGVCTSFHTNVSPTVWDDKEVSAVTLGFSPAGGQFLPNEVNVVEMGGSSVWDSSLAQSLSTNSADGLGWVNLNLVFTGANCSFANCDVDGDTGLPALGYTTQSFLGGAASYMVPTAYTAGDCGFVNGVFFCPVSLTPFGPF